jgi:hypothetical protein
MNAFTVVVLWMMMAFALLGGFGSSSALAQQSSGAAKNAEKLPPDIHLDSLSRMPRPKREDFTSDEEKQAFDRVNNLAADWDKELGLPIQGPNVASGWLGPTGTRSAIPEVAEIYRKQDIMIKKKSGLERKYIELAILVATHESNDKSSFRGHEAQARNNELLSPKVVDVVRNNEDTKGLEEKEALIIQLGREMYRGPIVSSKTFAAVERNFGRRGTLGMSLIMSYYTANALLMRVYDQHGRP